MIQSPRVAVGAERAPSAGWQRSVTAASVLLLLAGSLLPLLAALRHHSYLNDDAYITLTYAQNLAQGRGFVFNHSPSTLGTTSPLLTLIVALLGWLLPQVAVHVWAVLFTALCWLATAWLPFLFRRVWQLSAWQAAIIGLIILGTGWVGILGMESFLFSFLLMLSLSLYFAKRRFLAGLCLGLLFMTRGEGILVLFILVILAIGSEWIDQNRFGLGRLRWAFWLIGGFAIPVAAWSIYAFATFGTVLPNTLSAKRAQGMLETSRPFVVRLFQEWIPAWGHTTGFDHWAVVTLWWLLVAIGLASAVQHRRRWLVLLAWAMLYSLGYTMLGVAGYAWYQIPLLFVARLFLGLGLIATIEFLLARRWPAVARVSLSVVFATLIVVGLARPTAHDIRYYPGDARAASYLALSQWLRENTQPSDSVAYIEIGYLGYYTDNRIIDLAGLVLPDIVPHVAEGDWAWGFWHYQPDYFVYLPSFDWALAEIHGDPRFEAIYQPVAALGGPNNVELTLYKRRSALGQ